MSTTVIIIYYLFPMNNCVVKASESYEKSDKFALRSFANFHPGPFILWMNWKEEVCLWRHSSHNLKMERKRQKVKKTLQLSKKYLKIFF